MHISPKFRLQTLEQCLFPKISSVCMYIHTDEMHVRIYVRTYFLYQSCVCLYMCCMCPGLQVKYPKSIRTKGLLASDKGSDITSHYSRMFDTLLDISERIQEPML